MSLFNFVDFVGPTVPASYLNSLDQIRNALSASLGGAVTLAPISATGVPGATALSLAQSGLITLSGGLAVGGGAFTSRGITDNATATALNLGADGALWTTGQTDPGTSGVINTAGVQVKGVSPVSSFNTNSPVTITTVETYLNTPLAVPAGVLTTNSAFRMTIVGICTTTVANAVTWNVRYGSAGTTADPIIAVFSANAAAAGSSQSFVHRITIGFSGVGAAATGIVGFDVVNSISNIGIQAGATNTSAQAIANCNTTVASKLGVSLLTSAATTSLQIYSAIVERAF